MAVRKTRPGNLGRSVARRIEVPRDTTAQRFCSTALLSTLDYYTSSTRPRLPMTIAALPTRRTRRRYPRRLWINVTVS